MHLISTNGTKLMKELFTGLLRLQSFTRDSARHVGEEIAMLEGDVRNVREQLRRVDDVIDGMASRGASKVDQLAEISQQRLSTVSSWVLWDNADSTRS